MVQRLAVVRRLSYTWVVIEPIDWKHRAAYMAERHGVLPEEADEAVQDVDALWFDPDPKSRSGDSVRVIGYSHTAKAVLSVIWSARRVASAGTARTGGGRTVRNDESMRRRVSEHVG